MNEILQRLCRIGIVPVLSVEDAEKALGLANALSAGGLPAAEVTFRTQAGEESIRQIAENCPQVLVGAGTILNVEQCRRALAAGARFIVSPGYNEALVAYCLEQGVLVIPGCATASDLGRAVSAGLDLVKFFPAEQAGGLPLLKALAPVFPRLGFMPTGGISIKNLSDYLGYDRVRLCGGSWMAKSELIQGERWEDITTLCRQAVGTMLNFSLQHVGLPCGSADAAAGTAQAICRLFGLDYRQGGSSDFAWPFVECCKVDMPGTNGHIAIGTPDVDRAEFHLGLEGVEFLEHTRKVDNNGRTKAIYLKQTFAGFSIHLMRK